MSANEGVPLSGELCVRNNSAENALRIDRSFLSTEEQAALAAALRLSEREAEIVGLMILGRSESEMAQHLDISAHTVHSHVERLYRKLHVHSRCGVITALFKTYVGLREARDAVIDSVELAAGKP